jgi:hypothetical protein
VALSSLGHRNYDNTFSRPDDERFDSQRKVGEPRLFRSRGLWAVYVDLGQDWIKTEATVEITVPLR